MKNICFIFVFLVMALIVSLFSFSASAASAPGLSNESVKITGPHSATVSVSVNPNGSATSIHLRYWMETRIRNIYYTNVNGTSPVYINLNLFNLFEATNYSYQITATNSAGSVSGSVGSFTTPGPGGTSSGSGSTTSTSGSGTSTSSGSPSVATNGPVSVSANSAVINGSVNPNNSATSFWFEFGTTTSLGQMTNVQSLGSGSSWQLVTGNLSGLELGKTYYYRVAAQNSYGTNRGSILNFTTQNSQTGSQVLGSTSGSTSGGTTVSGSGTSSGSSGSGTTSGTSKTTTTTAKTSTLSRTPTAASNPAKDRPSFISLEYSLGNDGALVLVADNLKPKPGEEFSYTIVYKNDTAASFNSANLKVILPTEVDYIGSDRKPDNISANIVEFSLGNIAPNTQGTVIVIVKVKETTEPGTNMIFTSVLGYKDSKGTQLANTSYMTVRVGEAGTPLSASLGSFIGMSGMLWLIAFALMIMMGLLVFRLVRMRKNMSKTEKEEDIFGLGKVPATFEPIGQASSFRK